MNLMLGTFPMAFSQAATSQGYFPKRQLHKGTFPSGNFTRVLSQVATSQGYFPKWQLSKCAIFQAATVLVAAFGP